MTARSLQKRVEQEFAKNQTLPRGREVKRAILKGLVDTEQRSVIANLTCWFITAGSAYFLPNASYLILPLIFRLLAMVGTRAGFAKMRSALREERDVARAFNWLAASLFVGGSAWGSTLLPLLAFPTLHPARLLVAGGTLIGMSIIVTMLSPMRGLALSFSGGFLGAFGLGLYLTGAADGLVLMAGMTILFLIFIAYSHASTFGHERSAKLLVENRHLGESLRVSLERAMHMADHDSLTGLFNRRAFFTYGERAGWPQRLVIMIDIDHFKSINDRFGHATGDRVLESVGQAIGEVLKTQVGVDHIAARLGGEEFAIIMPFRSIAENRRTTEALHKNIAEIAAKLNVSGLVTTASLGVSIADGDTKLDDVLHEADMALYRAKAFGRNRTEYTDFPNEPTIASLA
jgi:diguanylate cyclase (GGDEF)-like protein